MFTEKENTTHRGQDPARTYGAPSVSPRFSSNERELRLQKREPQKPMISHPSFPGYVDFHYFVVDKLSNLSRYIRQGCTIAIEPFKSNLGTCAVVQDSSGKRICILDKGEAPFASNRF